MLEFAGPSARLLSVGERAVLAAIAPQLGAAAALFVSDEKTEVFLRDQRRSKAHRALVPDAGAPCDEVINVDLGAVDPLLLDEPGRCAPCAISRQARDAGAPRRRHRRDAPRHARRGGAPQDRSASRRASISSLAIPSRQMLEVLAAAGALVDLIATGARLVEPDARVVTGELYPPPRAGVSMRTLRSRAARRGATPFAVVASAETLAYAVATGEVGDPRSFKRPVRVTVPRALPTDDVLIARKAQRGEADPGGARRQARRRASPVGHLVEGRADPGSGRGRRARGPAAPSG